MTEIVIRSLLSIDVDSLFNEAQKLGKEFVTGANDGISKVYYITPDLTTGQKNALQTLIDKIGTGTIS